MALVVFGIAERCVGCSNQSLKDRCLFAGFSDLFCTGSLVRLGQWISTDICGHKRTLEIIGAHDLQLGGQAHARNAQLERA